MNVGRTIFTQLIDFVPEYEFRQCVLRHNGNRKIKTFSCRDQFLCMAFAQLTYREGMVLSRTPRIRAIKQSKSNDTRDTALISCIHEIFYVFKQYVTGITNFLLTKLQLVFT